MRSVAVVIILAITFFPGCRRAEQAPVPAPPIEQVAPVPNVADGSNVSALQGTWKVIAIESDLKKMPDDEVKNLDVRYTFNGKELAIRQGREDPKLSNYSVDNSAKPKRLAIYASNPPERCAYEINGTQLRLCIIVEDNPRGNYPTEFACKLSPRTDLLTLEKIEPAK